MLSARFLIPGFIILININQVIEFAEFISGNNYPGDISHHHITKKISISSLDG